MRGQIRAGTVTLRHIQVVKIGGREYRYFRAPNMPRVKLPDLPADHPDFLAAYVKAASAEKVQIKADTGTIAEAIDACLRSAPYKTLSRAYQLMLARHFGDIRVQAEGALARDLLPEHIEEDLSQLDAHLALKRLKAWRYLTKFGKPKGLFTGDVAARVEAIKVPRSDGHIPWTVADVDVFRSCWPMDTVQRLCFEVIHWTGARISDACLIGDGHIGGDGVLAFKQVKTGNEAYVPWTCSLPHYAEHIELDRAIMHTALDARKKRHMTFLATAHGRTRSHKAIGNLIGEAARAAGLERSAHGLRKTRAIALVEGGAATHEVMAWTGHATLTEIQRYTDKFNRRSAVRGKPVKRLENEIVKL